MVVCWTEYDQVDQLVHDLVASHHVHVLETHEHGVIGSRIGISLQFLQVLSQTVTVGTRQVYDEEGAENIGVAEGARQVHDVSGQGEHVLVAHVDEGDAPSKPLRVHGLYLPKQCWCHRSGPRR